MASPLDTLAPPSSGNPLDALPPPQPSQTPLFDKIPGFSYVKPVADLAAGAGSGLAQTAAGVYDLLRKIPGADKLLPDSKTFHDAIQNATPDTTPAHVGKFLEGVTEYAIPAAKAAEATRGMGLVARTLAQAGVGGGVSAAQTGGDPAATATGTVLGAGGEVLSDVARGAAGLLANKAPTLANFAESFGGATPTQKARISRALGTLTKDGVVPPGSVYDMQDVIKGKLDELGQAYQNLDPAIKAREVDPADVVDHLRDLQRQYTRRGVVTDPAAYNTIEREIGKVQDIAMKNGGRPAPQPSGLVGPNGQPIPPSGVAVPGKVNVDDIVHLKNGRTNWNSTAADKSLWEGIGDAYRGAADAIAPEITPLNRDWQHYTGLERMIDENIARGKGTTPSGLSQLVKQGIAASAGGKAGAALGAPLGPVGAGVGGLVGTIAGPKLGKAAAQALQNAVDSGAFRALTPVRQGLLRTMSTMGDNAGVLKLLGTAATEESAAGR